MYTHSDLPFNYIDMPADKNTEHSLSERFERIRKYTETLAAPLSAEDTVAQSMPDASPTKWHLAHISWFFETFLLSPYLPGYQVFDSSYSYLFNSYYETLGPRQPRLERGLLTRPPLDDVMAYRRYVDLHMQSLLKLTLPSPILAAIELGLAHEQQHQELLLMDILHLFSKSALKPAYSVHWPAHTPGRSGNFRQVDGGLVDIGAVANQFCFDNELPRHQVFLQPFEISDRLVTNAEWLAFIDDGGYERFEHWLSEGWALNREEGWSAPLYWTRTSTGWSQMTLRGMEPIVAGDAVTHINYYEAAAYAHWAGARLPTESEWEAAAQLGLLEQADGVAWQWTQTAYSAYPGFRVSAGAVGEYNGKFMVNQMVLRGGCSFTPAGHTRLSYRNFFRTEKRWMQSGLRLAKDAK